MVLRPVRTFLFSCGALTLTATATFAQDANYTSVDATSDKPVQVGYHASAKNCTASIAANNSRHRGPQIWHADSAKSRAHDRQDSGVPRSETPAQVVLYLARAGYAGPDHVKYEVTSENGEVATNDVTITVKAAPAQSPPPQGIDRCERNDDIRGGGRR